MKNPIHGGDIYEYGRTMLDLSANINPLGMPREIREAVIARIGRSEEYPDPSSRALRKAIGDKYQLSPSRIVCGNGAADLIYRIMFALRPQYVLAAAPLFSEYDGAAKAAGSRIDFCMLREENDFLPDEHFLKLVESVEFEMVVLGNPSNPSGGAVSGDYVRRLARICEKRGIWLVVDECFADFLMEEEKHSLMGDIRKFPHLIIVRSFTKIFAMAGLRLGFIACGSRDAAEKIGATLQPWAVSSPAEAAGIAACGLDDFVRRTKNYVAAEREFLAAGLRKIGLPPVRSDVNYLLFRGPRLLGGLMKDQGILLRDCSNYQGLGEGWFRTAVRTREENEKMLACARSLLTKFEGRMD